MQPTYQLTKHPVGSLAEVWAVSWPLMLSLCSQSLMNFADRLFLAHYSVEAMNAVTVAGAFCFVLMAFPLTICEITGVFVGRYHGQDKPHLVGKPVWQIMWLALASWPVFMLSSRFIAPYLFAANSLETVYFVRYLDFVPFLLCSFAMMGFFLGLGKTKVITCSTIAANIINAILAPLLIYGTAFTPSMGIEGAAYATGCAQALQALILLALFLRKKYRDAYQTAKCVPDKVLMKEMLFVGIPAGIGRATESLAHGFCFRIIAMSGAVELTCATIAQSVYMLVVFCVYGISKGVTAIISNLVGAKVSQHIPKTIASAIKIHTILFCLLAVTSIFSAEMLLNNVLNDKDLNLLEMPQFLFSVKFSLFCMSLFFLLKGFSWIMVGHLTALGDTKFVMYVNAITHWLSYILPIYLLVTMANGGASVAWAIIALNSFFVFAIFWWRSKGTFKKQAPYEVLS